MHGFPRADLDEGILRAKLSRGKTKGISTSLRVPPVYFLANDRDRETIGGDISDPSESFEYVQPQRHENKVHYVNFIPYRVQLNSLRVSRTWSGSDSKKLMKPPA